MNVKNLSLVVLRKAIAKDYGADGTKDSPWL